MSSKKDAKPAAKPAAKPVTKPVAKPAAKPVSKVPEKKATPAAAKKATAASKVIKQGNRQKAGMKIRTSVHFRRPKVLRLHRNPKYSRKSIAHRPRMDKYRVIRFPLCTESAMKQIEDNNTLTFIVDITANKRQIKEAVKSLYEVDTVKVNTLIRPDGTKKAYVRLDPGTEALEVANRIGII